MVFASFLNSTRLRTARSDSLPPPPALTPASAKRPSSSGGQNSEENNTNNKSFWRREASPHREDDDDNCLPEYIADESQLAPPADDAPDLRELNNSLAALAVVFPDVQVDVFREMLTSFDGESRLALVADALLKNRVTWVKGRWRVDKPESPPPSAAAPDAAFIPPADRFRSPAYQKAATALACHEFVGLSRSTIQAVLAEQNYAYLAARHALVQVSSKSWRVALSSLLLRRKPPVLAHANAGVSGANSGEAENDPLIVWKSSGKGSILPTIRATGCPELDAELFAALVVPLRTQRRTAQEDADRTLAASVNLAEAEETGALYECGCCYTTTTFEDMTSCSGLDGHVICFRCVQQCISEAVFGQGWARTIDVDRGTLRCPCPAEDSSTNNGVCEGIVPADQVHRALASAAQTGSSSSSRGDLLGHLERRLAEHSLVSSGLPLVRCPFCAYAEVDDIYVPFHEAPLRVRVDSLYSLVLLLVLFGATPVLIILVAVLTVVAALLPTLAQLTAQWQGADPARRRRRRGWSRSGFLGRGGSGSDTTKKSYWGEQVAGAVRRYRRRRRGQQFRCQRAACGRVSCLGCGKAWVDVHVCHESALVALRTQVEQAMSMAIKRVCPRCHTSFVKTAGCNKLTCPCGYKMCYVCRRDISGTEGPDAGYRHFCEHFRPHGDGRPCTQCRKCNLWESEDTEAVLAAARAQAERRWRETERRDLSPAERAFLETGIAAKPTAATAATRRLVGSVWGSDTPKTLHSNNNDNEHQGGVSFTFRMPSVPELLDWLLESVLV